MNPLHDFIRAIRSIYAVLQRMVRLAVLFLLAPLAWACGSRHFCRTASPKGSAWTFTRASAGIVQTHSGWALDDRIVPSFTLSLQNLTGLAPSGYGLYVVGYSNPGSGAGDNLYLDNTTNGQFVSGQSGKSYLVPVALSAINYTITLGTQQTINSGELLFFVAPLTNNDPGTFIDTGLQINSAGGVVQPANGATTYTYTVKGVNQPPVNLPPYGQIEFSANTLNSNNQPDNQIDAIDYTTVNDFAVPMSISNTANAQTVGVTPPSSAGATPPVTRSQIFSAYTQFLSGFSSAAQADFSQLVISTPALSGLPYQIESPDNFLTPVPGIPASAPTGTAHSVRSSAIRRASWTSAASRATRMCPRRPMKGSWWGPEPTPTTNSAR